MSRRASHSSPATLPRPPPSHPSPLPLNAAVWGESIPTSGRGREGRQQHIKSESEPSFLPHRWGWEGGREGDGELSFFSIKARPDCLQADRQASPVLSWPLSLIAPPWGRDTRERELCCACKCKRTGSGPTSCFKSAPAFSVSVQQEGGGA